MPKINVTNLLRSTSLLTAEKGTDLFDAIINKLKANKKVVIDFSGFDFLSTSFLNNSFGQIALDFGWSFEEMKKRIEILGLDEDDIEEIELAVFNALSKKNLIEKGIDIQEFYAKHLAY